MIFYRALCIVVAGLTSSACGRAATLRVAARPTCRSTWRAAWGADSAVAVCLAPGFAAAPGSRDGAHQRWVRPLAAGQPQVGLANGDWLSVSLDTAAAASEPWPPRLASGPTCSVDCATADSVAAHRDKLDGGAEAQVEAGLISGGMPGFRRQPALVAGWVTPGGTRVWVNGMAAHPGTLDTLRAMLRTVRVAGAP